MRWNREPVSQCQGLEGIDAVPRGEMTLRRTVTRSFSLVLALAIVLTGAKIWQVVRAPVRPPASALLVNDISELNNIHVGEIVTPKTTGEIVELVKNHSGPISI